MKKGRNSCTPSLEGVTVVMSTRDSCHMTAHWITATAARIHSRHRTVAKTAMPMAHTAMPAQSAAEPSAAAHAEDEVTASQVRTPRGAMTWGRRSSRVMALS